MQKLIKILIFFILGLIINCFEPVLAQDTSYIKNRVNIKASYSRIHTNGIFKRNYFQLSGSYGLFNLLEPGAYIGLSSVDIYLLPRGKVLTRLAPFFGLNTHFHILPLFVQSDEFRFDLYLTGQVGGVYLKSEKNYLPETTCWFEYSGGGGVAFYLGKHFGIYGEYCMGDYLLKEDKRWLLGLTFKF